MRGKVAFIDSFSGDALIEGADGRRYEFKAPPGFDRLRLDNTVEFVPAGEGALELVNLDAGADPPRGWRARGARFDLVWALFSFNGRLRRSHFWIVSLLTFAVWVAILVLTRQWFLGLPLLWPNLAIGVKRLHDMGRSGGFVAVPHGANALVFAAVVVLAALDDSPQVPAIVGLMAVGLAVLGLVFWLWLGVARSQPGPNRFGSHPVASAQHTADAFS